MKTFQKLGRNVDYVKFLSPVHNFKKDNGKKFVTYVDSFAPNYVPKEVEKTQESQWIRQKYLQDATNKKKFSILLPPPNITGSLHLGHALTVSIQDVIVRWHRMRGIDTVWVPGVDHAGIATQVVVEKAIWQQSQQTRHAMGREKFVENVWDWKRQKADVIAAQLRRLGASLDWSRGVFTMDPVQSDAVTTAFIRLFDADLIYRANAMVNWSCVLRSAISAIEVENLEIAGRTPIPVPGYDAPVEFGVLTRFAYKIQGSDKEIVVATTRPETILGDVAVAVHPEDDRYAHLRFQKVWHPFRKEEIPIIFDEFVDRSFGTGAVKVTPAHDKVDYDVSLRHKLPVIPVINELGYITKVAGFDFKGLRRFDARTVILKILHDQNLIRGMVDHAMSVPVCSRSRDIVEYQLKPQWFIKCAKMAARAVRDMKEGRLEIDPPTYQREWYQWLENIRDWNISRQLWWGHQIPAYKCWVEGTRNNPVWVAAQNIEEARIKAQRFLPVDKFKICRDEDVLDTWFSSALLPFSTFGWPQQTADLSTYYPQSVVETGRDILFFWVARMVMLGTELTGQLPFKKILLHGIICDVDGRKMSKSLGNVVAPEDVINGISLKELQAQTISAFKSGLISKSEQQKTFVAQQKMFPKGIPACGADALRFTLCSHNIKNQFINFDVEECRTNRLFCNKIWQATRYTRIAVERLGMRNLLFDASRDKLSQMDQWIMDRLFNTVQTVNTSLSNADLHLATGALKEFLYRDFCDIYLESTKPGLLANSSRNVALGHCITLCRCLDTGLLLLAPFMPFLFEELYAHIPRRLSTSLEKISFPIADQFAEWHNPVLLHEVNMTLAVVGAIRKLVSQNGNLSKEHIQVCISSWDPVYQVFREVIETLTGQKCVVMAPEEVPNVIASDTVGPNCSVHITLKDGFHVTLSELNFRTYSKKEAQLVKELTKLRKITAATGYISKAPKDVQVRHTEKIQNIVQELTNLRNVKRRT